MTKKYLKRVLIASLIPLTLLVPPSIKITQLEKKLSENPITVEYEEKTKQLESLKESNYYAYENLSKEIAEIRKTPEFKSYRKIQTKIDFNMLPITAGIFSGMLLMFYGTIGRPEEKTKAWHGRVI